MKSIEVYYDIAGIPGIAPGDLEAALTFRNAAMEYIEDALLDADAGEWEGAEIGQGAVNFGFAVEDFDRAEAIVRKRVAGTKYDHICKIARNEFEPADFC